MKFSILSLASLRYNQTYKEALDDMIRLAQKAEKLGYQRFWVAEHHNTSKTASSATQVLIQHILQHTDKMRVGAGGVMLPNHSPYLVAEQYGTLEALYPNRIDLGLGRAPGTDMNTAMAIRRNHQGREFSFPAEVRELQGYFAGTNPVHAYPAEGLNVPIYILGSSTDSAYLAAELGLPYSFASHFAPAQMEESVAIYRRNFKPSAYLDKPYVILGINVALADTTEEAERLATSHLQAFANIVTGTPAGILPPLNSKDEVWEQMVSASQAPHFGPVAFDAELLKNRQKQVVEQMFSVHLVGDKAQAKEQLKALQARVDFDEIMAVSYIYDEQAQHHSYQLLAEVVEEMKDE